MVIKEHWLYGKCQFNVEVFEEDECSECIHEKVCQRDMSDFCLNYKEGISEDTICDGCIHRYTRYFNKEKYRIPCFKCKYFLRKGLVI